MRRTRRITRRAATRSPAARIVVVTEGGSTEPAYLRVFGRIYGEPSAVRLNIIPAAGDPRAVVERAITELRKLRGDKLASKDTVWAMFDRDEHPRFDEARIMARDNGISMAISNPCFELWGIFHYRDYDAPLDRPCQPPCRIPIAQVLHRSCQSRERRPGRWGAFAPTRVPQREITCRVLIAGLSITRSAPFGQVTTARFTAVCSPRPKTSSLA